MNRESPFSYRYKVGGTLGVKDPSYIEREADTILYENLKNGEYCYVLNPRQMGKSSLKVRTIKKLQQEENFICANIDLSSIGKTLTERQWYESLIFNLKMQFDNYGEFNWNHRSINYELLPPIEIFNQFIDKILEYISNHIVIFIDEIDIILSLKDFTDDLFLSIREYYNRRSCQEKYQRLTFCFLGVIDRSDLIKSTKITPFNIGKSIELNGFTKQEARSLTIGLSQELTQQQKQNILDQILQWTGGQPFLTQKILSLMVAKSTNDNPNIDEFIKQHIIDNWHYQDQLLHLKTIEKRLLYDQTVVPRLLGIYKKILEHTEIETDTSVKVEESKLLLSGLVVQQGNKLRVKCKIYKYIFNINWVNKELDKVRPYDAETIDLWLQNAQDKSKLLQGTILEDALNWSANQNVSVEDHKFINASQKLANKRKLTNAIAKILLGCLIFTGFVIYSSNLIVTERKNLTLEIKQSKLEFQLGQEMKALRLVMQVAERLKTSKLIYSAENTDYLVSELGHILSSITQKNHLQLNNKIISSVNFNPQGNIMATGLDNGDIKLWNIEEKKFKTLKGHKNRIYNVKFNEDGTLLGSVSEDGDINLWSLENIWNLADPQPITLHFPTEKKAVYSISFRERKIAVSSRDGLVGLWESPQDQTPAIFRASSNEIYDVSFSKDGKIVTASKDGLVQLWDSPEDTKPETLINNKEAIYSLSWGLDNEVLAAASRDGTVTLLKMTDKSKTTINAHSKEVYDVVFSSHNLIATASEDKQIKIWDLTGREVKTIKVNRGAVHNVNFSPDGQILAAVSADGTVNIWDVKKYTDFPSGISVSNFSLDGRLLAFGSKQGQVYLIKLTSQEMRKKLSENKDSEVKSLSFSPEEKWLAFGSKKGQVYLMDLTTNKLQLEKCDDVAAEVYSLSFAQNNKWLAAGTSKGNIHIWSLINGNCQLLQDEPNNQNNSPKEPIYSLKFFHDAGKSLLLIGDNKGTLRIFNLEEKQWEDSQQVHTKAIHKISISAEGIIATASGDNTVKLFTIEDGKLKEQQSLLGGGEENNEDAIHNGPVSDVIFSLNNNMLVTTSTDKYIRIWEKTNHEIKYLERFKEPEAGVNSIQFQSNQKLLIAKNDGTLASWYINQSKLERLNNLLRDGCLWLEDYLSTQPEETKELIGCNSLDQ